MAYTTGHSRLGLHLAKPSFAHSGTLLLLRCQMLTYTRAIWVQIPREEC